MIFSRQSARPDYNNRYSMSDHPHHRRRKHHPPTHPHGPTGAAGAKFSRQPVNTLGAPHPPSPTARFHGKRPRKQFLATSADLEKITRAARLTVAKLPINLRDTASEVLSPQTLRTLTALACARAASHLAGAGKPFDIVMIGWGTWTFRPQALDSTKGLFPFVRVARNAKNDRDIDRAAGSLGRLIIASGVAVIPRLLTNSLESFRKAEGGGTQPQSATPQATGQAAGKGVAPPPDKASPPPLDYRKSGKGGTTEVAVDDKNKKVYIKTSMEFCGAGATEDYAKAAKKQIEDTWSGKMKRNKEDYDVVVTITTSVSKKCTGSKDADQIVVDDSTTRMNQSLYGKGPGHQTPAAATDKGRPRRIAHEYGHTLGLEDGYEDTPEGSKPKDPNKKNDIMSETWPDKDGVLPHPHQDHYDQVLKNHGW